MPENTISSIEYLTTVRLGEQRQITVPKEFRELCDRIAETFTTHDITADDLIATLPEARKRVAKRHYPELFEDEED